MPIARYDIFQLDEGPPIWIESAGTIELLRSRLQDLQGRYAHLMVYDTQTDLKLKPLEILNDLGAPENI